MREYQLASSVYREQIDLTKHRRLIERIVHKYVPDGEVTVNHESFLIEQDITKGQAIMIGRDLAKTELGKYCIQRPSLFVGRRIGED
jgi:hypothetical protein